MKESAFNWNKAVEAVPNPFETATNLEEIIALLKEKEDVLLPIDLEPELSDDEKAEIRKGLIMSVSNFCTSEETDFKAAGFIEKYGGEQLMNIVTEVSDNMTETPISRDGLLEDDSPFGAPEAERERPTRLADCRSFEDLERLLTDDSAPQVTIGTRSELDNQEILRIIEEIKGGIAFGNIDQNRFEEELKKLPDINELKTAVIHSFQDSFDQPKMAAE